MILLLLFLFFDENDEDEEYIDPEEELLDEVDTVFEERQTFDDVGATGNNEEYDDYDSMYDNLFFDEIEGNSDCEEQGSM